MIQRDARTLFPSTQLCQALQHTFNEQLTPRGKSEHTMNEFISTSVSIHGTQRCHTGTHPAPGRQWAFREEICSTALLKLTAAKRV